MSSRRTAWSTVSFRSPGHALSSGTRTDSLNVRNHPEIENVDAGASAGGGNEIERAAGLLSCADATEESAAKNTAA
jgi:hypothetical protein